MSNKVITSEQLEALKALRKLMVKYDLRFESDDPYCGVEVKVGKDLWVNVHKFTQLDEFIENSTLETV